jgi:hypothetical protein
MEKMHGKKCMERNAWKEMHGKKCMAKSYIETNPSPLYSIR